MVANQAGQGHRRGVFLRGFQYQTHVFESQGQGKAGGLEALVSHYASVVCGHGRPEQRGHGFQEEMAIDPRFAHGGERFSEGFEHACDHEIAAEFHGVGLPRQESGCEGLASQGLEHRAASLDEVRDKVLSYLMYPEVFLKYARASQAYGDVEVLPTPLFYYGMERGEDIVVELEAGKALVIKFLTVGEPHPDGTRTVFFELNGQPREVTIRDRKLEVKEPARPKADPNQPGQIGASIPGVVSTVAVELNQQIKIG